MKINKELKQTYIKHIKNTAKEFGYKAISNTIYKVQDDCIIYADFLIVDLSRFLYHIYIKKMSFDDLFWKIMDMEENARESFSLRVNGAFVSPGVLIHSNVVDIPEDVCKMSYEFLNVVETKSMMFYKNNDIVNYILSNDNILDHDTLKCLAYIDSDDMPSAVAFAKRQVENGNSGGYINGDKGFFERVLTYNAL